MVAHWFVPKENDSGASRELRSDLTEEEKQLYTDTRVEQYWTPARMASAIPVRDW